MNPPFQLDHHAPVAHEHQESWWLAQQRGQARGRLFDLLRNDQAFQDKLFVLVTVSPDGDGDPKEH